jgi:hypothetical protein
MTRLQYKEILSMAQPDPIDTILAELREDLSNTLTMLGIALALRRNSAHLLQLVRSMLGDLSERIDQALPILPAGEDDDNA